MKKEVSNKELELRWLALGYEVKKRNLTMIYELLKDIEQLESDTKKEIKE